MLRIVVSHRLAVVLILSSALGFGAMALFAKLAYASGVTPAMLLALRFGLAVALLAPVVFLRRLRLPRGRTLLGFAFMGLLYTAQSQAYFTALLHASSGLVGLLLYAYPVLVTLIGVGLGWERPDLRTCLLLALAIAGMAVTLGSDLQGTPLGIALGLAAAGIYALYIVTGGRIMAGVDPLAGTLVIMTAAAVGNGVLALGSDAALPADATAWMAVAAIALFSTVMAIAFFLVGIKYVGAARASIISTIEPVITIALGVAVLGETISTGQLVGGAMVLAAVILLAARPHGVQQPSRQSPAAG